MGHTWIVALPEHSNVGTGFQAVHATKQIAELQRRLGFEPNGL